VAGALHFLRSTHVVVKDSGHWLMEEKPKETSGALIKLF
jgi:pimeloyl-ACP methyl ester carboxylesterase